MDGFRRKRVLHYLGPRELRHDGAFPSGSRYVNYLDQDETADRVAAAYGPNHHRLRELKAQYDPGNFFQGNQNIRPLG